MISLKKDKAKIVIGDKDTVLNLKNGTFYIYSLDGKQTLSIEFKHEENLRTVIDMLSYLYYSTYYREQIPVNTQKANNEIERARKIYEKQINESRNE